jgi:hypothetical protein
LPGLVRKLIDYGKERAGIVLQPAAAADICLCVNVGTRNVALMFARITRGLMLLAALEARLIGLVGRAERQRPAADAAAAAAGSSRRASRVQRRLRARGRQGAWRIPSHFWCGCPRQRKSTRSSAVARLARSSPISAAILGS